MSDRILIIDALIRVAFPLIAALLLPAIKAWIDRNAQNRELQLALQLADVAVKSVEGDLRTETGQAKKAEAMVRLAAAIASWGLKGFTTQELDHYIQTAWNEMQADDPGALQILTTGITPCPEPAWGDPLTK